MMEEFFMSQVMPGITGFWQVRKLICAHNFLGK